MKSSDLALAVHGEFDNDLAKTREAEAFRDSLVAEYAHKTERVLTAAALLHNFPDWRLTRGMGAFSASWVPEHGFHACVGFYLTLPKVKSWGDLVPLIELLDQHGINSDDWESRDHAESYTRTFKNFLLNKAHARVEVRIDATLPGDTDTCRRVVVGYTDPLPSEPQPIYEMRCD